MRHMLNETIYVEHEKTKLGSQTKFEDMWKVFDTIKPTPNPFNRKTNILRRQCTYGAQYNFGGQQSFKINLDCSEWPILVQQVLQDVKEREVEHGDIYSVVHVNFYPDGKAGLDIHSDNETDHVEGHNIYSYTFLSEPGNPRGFQIYNMKDEKIHEVMLDNGELLIMCGGMQKEFKHGVKKSSAKRYTNLKRINMTVRAWKDTFDHGVCSTS